MKPQRKQSPKTKPAAKKVIHVGEVLECGNCLTGILDEDGLCQNCDWQEDPTLVEAMIFWTVLIGCPLAVAGIIAYLALR